MSPTAPDTAPSNRVPGTRRHPDARAAPPHLPRGPLGHLRHAAPALLAYLAVRLTGLLALTVWAHRRHEEVWPILATQWDADWYLGIADHGYTRTLGTEYDANNLAFFPLYPMLVRAVSALTPVSPAATGLGIAVVASLVAAWGVFAVGDHLHGRRTGVLLTTLWAALPVGLVQWTGYTESLFTACAAWSLYAVLTHRRLTAAAFAALAGLTRPTGIAVATAVTVAALLALRRRPRPRRALAAALLAPLGWCGYVGWVGLRLHRWDGYRTLAQCSILQGGGVGHPAGCGPEGRSAMAKIALSDNGVVGPTAGRAGSQACGGRVRPTFTGRRWPVKQEPEVVPRSGTDRNLLPSGRRGRQCGAYMALVWPSAP